MTDCKPCSTPVDTQAKLSADLGDPVVDPTAYRTMFSNRLVGPGRLGTDQAINRD